MTSIALINKGNSQTLKIPSKYKIKSNKIYIKKIGNALYLIPFDNPWQSLFDSLKKFSDDFLESREQPEQLRETL